MRYAVLARTTTAEGEEREYNLPIDAPDSSTALDAARAKLEATVPNGFVYIREVRAPNINHKAVALAALRADPDFKLDVTKEALRTYFRNTNQAEFAEFVG